ncbi:MAG: Putative glycosyltransferase EpsE [uncultured Sulfurovum sp.]|uniref:Glycosyltransferase EpsE n=1 Tax=uncultured Sulfurovum sp. TaxID=269237 RepID=A0A6S6TC81_9BACT|nr:MAG: Putative glycosyltransferase EpsE [uncultured Sulfurovum sp.]
MNLNSEPIITIVIPSYNHELYIEKCLLEILKIDIKKNILIIDDGSTDNTPLILERMLLELNNQDIEFIQKENSGLVNSLNLAISKTNTKYLYLIASDDLVNPNSFVKCIYTMIAKPELKFIIAGSENLFENSTTSVTYRRSHELFFDNTDEEIRKKLFLDYPKPLLLQSTIFKTEVLKSVGGWDEDVVLDDYSMFIKLLLKYSQHKDYIFDPSIVVCKYRIHESNSSKNYIRQYSMVKQVISKYAPLSLKSKAIGNRLAFYIMLCIKEKRINMLKTLMVNASTYEILLSLTSIPIIYYKYIYKKL